MWVSFAMKQRRMKIRPSVLVRKFSAWIHSRNIAGGAEHEDHGARCLPDETTLSAELHSVELIARSSGRHGRHGTHRAPTATHLPFVISAATHYSTFAANRSLSKPVMPALILRSAFVLRAQARACVAGEAGGCSARTGAGHRQQEACRFLQCEGLGVEALQGRAQVCGCVS